MYINEHFYTFTKNVDLCKSVLFDKYTCYI